MEISIGSGRPFHYGREGLREYTLAQPLTSTLDSLSAAARGMIYRHTKDDRR